MAKPKKQLKKNQVLKIHSSEDVIVEYRELCDVDAIHNVIVGDSEFSVSYRAKYDGIPEPQIVILGDDEDVVICTTKKLTKTQIPNAIKTAFISYMVGKGDLKIV